MLAFTLLVSFATGIAFGFFPALQISALDLNNALKESGRGSTSGTHNRVRGGLIVSEVALALTLLIGAGLLFESFWHLWSTPTGFNPKGALVLDISLPEAKNGRHCIGKWTIRIEELKLNSSNDYTVSNAKPTEP